MLHYTVLFLVIALVAAVFGFGGIAPAQRASLNFVFCIFGADYHFFFKVQKLIHHHIF